MKQKLKQILVVLTLVVFTITGCSSNKGSDISTKENDNKVKIVTSFYPMYLLTSEIVKDADNIELINMVDSSTGCLHDYSLTTDNMKLLEDCDIFVVNGAGMESFLDKVIQQKPDLKIVDASEGIELIETNYEDDEHSHDHDHDHDEEYNPHVWLSVKNAIKQVQNIESKLIEYNPENKDIYSNNTKEYVSQLNELDTKIHTELDKIENKNIVTFHEAFPYFAKEYNLNIVAVVQREAGSEPSAKELQETIEKIKKLDVKAICVEPQYSTKSAETISKETNVKVCTLDPIVTEESKNSSYIDIMNKNLETLKEALQ
ncbi:metal ABC transporter substrate-binding protein [Romboutsia sp. 13368]|uniref:metal ABC transporter substrate-binding protein n=1 Tax=Romboutsia sp. 13368 TaxID=2708053 RepID=UPI0025FD60BA|nr:metal ABC transporter substrate-binding protein [Romboutsia sp. 13368]